MAILQLGIDARPAKQGADEFASSAGLAKTSAAGAAASIDALEKALFEMAKASRDALRAERERLQAEDAARSASERAARAAREEAAAREQQAAAEAVASQREAEGRAQARGQLDQYLASLKRERELLALSESERQIAIAQYKAEELAIAGGIDDRAQLLSQVRSEIELQQELVQGAKAARAEAAARDRAIAESVAAQQRESDARKAAAAQLEQYVTGLTRERDLLRLSDNERQIAIAQRKAEELAIAAGIGDREKLLAQVRTEVQLQQQLVRGNAAAASSYRAVENEITRTSQSSQILGRVTSQLFVGLSAALVLRDTYKTVRDFEQGLVGVAKTTDLAGESLERLSARTLKLSTEIPTAAADLFKIEQTAGQLGVRGAGNLEKFAATVAKLASATDLAGDEGATSLARMLNVTGEAIGTVDVLGSVIVALGNNSAATEREITNMATEVALATAIFGTSSAQAAALGAAMASLGIRAELGGTVVGDAFRAIDAAIRGQGEELKALAQITGKTEAEISKIFSEDSVQGFQLFVEGLGRVIDSGGDGTKTLELFGLQGDRVLKVLPSLAHNSEVLARSLKIAAAETQNATALNREAERAYQTLGSRVTLFGNAYDAVQVKIAGSNGALADFVDLGTETLRILAGIHDESKQASTEATVLAEAIKFAAIAAAAFAAVQLAVYLGSLGLAAIRAAAAWNTLTIAMARNPVTAIAVGVAALTASLYTFGPTAEDSALATGELARQTGEYGISLQAVADAQKNIAKARLFGDSAAELAALNAQARQLKDTIFGISQAGEQKPVKLQAITDLNPNADTSKLAKALFDKLRADFVAQGSKGSFSDVLEQSGYFKRVQPDLAKTISGPLFGALHAGLVTDSKQLAEDALEVRKVFEELHPEALLKSLTLVALPKDNALAALNEELGDTEAAAKKAREALATEAPATGVDDSEAKKLKSAREALNEYIATMQFEDSIRELSNEEQSIERELRQGIQLLIRANVKDIDAETTALEARIRKQHEAAKASEDQTEADEKHEALYKLRTESLQSLKDEARLLSVSADKREEEAAVMALENAARAAGVDLSDEEIETLRRMIEHVQELREQRQALDEAPTPSFFGKDDREDVDNQAAQALFEMALSLREEQAALHLTNEERERSNFLRKVERELIASGTADREKVLAQFEREYDALKKAEKLKAVADDIGKSFADNLLSITTGFQTAEQAALSWIHSLIAMVLQELAAKPLASAFSSWIQTLGGALGGGGGGPYSSQTGGHDYALGGIFNAGEVVQYAHGGIFSSSPIIPFAGGGLVSSPTYFPLAGGRTGLMGEAGPEAVVPLGRGSDGELGLKLKGGEMGGAVYNTVNMKVYAKDADSFRKAERQITRSISGRLRR